MGCSASVFMTAQTVLCIPEQTCGYGTGGFSVGSFDKEISTETIKTQINRLILIEKRLNPFLQPECTSNELRKTIIMGEKKEIVWVKTVTNVLHCSGLRTGRISSDFKTQTICYAINGPFNEEKIQIFS